MLNNVEKIRKAIKEDDPNYADLINEVNLQYVAITRAQKEVEGEFYNNNLTKQDIEKYIEQLKVYFEEVKKVKQTAESENVRIEESYKTNNKGNKNNLFKPNETKLYHKIYGEGIFIRWGNKKDLNGKEITNIYVRFGNGDIKAFIYPDSLGKYLFLEKPDGGEAKKSHINNKPNIFELGKEQNRTNLQANFLENLSIETSGEIFNKELLSNNKWKSKKYNQAQKEKYEEYADSYKMKGNNRISTESYVVFSLCVNCKKFGSANCPKLLTTEVGGNFYCSAYLPKQIEKYEG
ncbi:MAG TPA: hypothetical protein VIK77_08585 [Tissierellaceae bacterium]